VQPNDRSCDYGWVNKGSSTYGRLLESGLKIGSTVGIRWVTLGNLADDVGLSKSGLFAHFGSKDDLQIALFGHAQELAKRTVVQPAFQKAEGLARLRALVDNWFGWTVRAGLPGGCPFAGAAFEFDDLEGLVRDHVVAAHQEWVGLLEGLTREAVATRELRQDLDVEQFVWELHGIYLSHHVSQRLLNDRRTVKFRETAVDRLFLDATSTAKAKAPTPRKKTTK
jgi:AcrR family transcriptional regulator